MKKTVIVFGMVAVTGVLYGCGGGGGSTSSGVTTTVAAPAITTTKTTIATPAEAAKTVNASKTLASSFASGASFPSLGSLVAKPTATQAVNGQKIISTVRDVQQKVSVVIEKQKALGKRVAATGAAESMPCTDGGTISFDAASDPVIMSFNGCKESGQYTNGSMRMPQSLMGSTSASGGSITMNMTTIGYAAGGYTTKEYESVMNLTMSVTSFDSTAGTESFSMNGYETNIDYVSHTSDKQSFGNFSLTMSDGSLGTVTSTDMAMSGSVSMDSYNDTIFTLVDTSSGMTFQNLRLVESYDTSTSISELTINGIYAIKTIPACMDGSFEISTQTPLTTDSSGVTTGQMTVNGIVMVFNADGTVTATIDGVPQVIDSYANVCSLSF